MLQRFVTHHAKMAEDVQHQADVNVPVVQEACIAGTFAKHVSLHHTMQHGSKINYQCTTLFISSCVPACLLEWWHLYCSWSLHLYQQLHRASLQQT